MNIRDTSLIKEYGIVERIERRGACISGGDAYSS
jgi:hypothetical protein